MHDQRDVRVRRTHANLRAALLDLIEEKGFDAVTVADIADRALVNRTTFYRHYPDKYALVTSIFEEALQQMFREIGSLPPSFDDLLFSHGTVTPDVVQAVSDSVTAAWKAFFEHVSRHARLYRIMLGKRGSSWFATQMRDSFAEAIRLRAQALAVQPGRKLSSDPQAAPLEFVVSSLASWFVGMLTWWVEHEMAYAPEQMTIWSARFALYGYPAALGLSVSPPIGDTRVP